MKILSVNIGKPKEVIWRGDKVLTSIFKQAASLPQEVNVLGLVNDTQSDKRHHGGDHKALYCYDNAHYSYWKKELDWDDWNYGLFGENLSTSGFLDDEVEIGDIYKMGDIQVQVIQPRFPCSRLNIRFSNPSMVKLFANSRRHGIYLKVLTEGSIKVGDKIELVEKGTFNLSIQQVVDCFYDKNAKMATRIALNPLIPKGLKKDFS